MDSATALPMPSLSEAAPVSDSSEPSLLDALQAQYSRMLSAQQTAAQQTAEWQRSEVEVLRGQADEALARAADERALLERRHTAEMETHRRATAVAIRSLHAELESLRDVHKRDLEVLRRGIEEERAYLRDWCEAQLSAVVANREAELDKFAERGEDERAAGDSRIAAMQAEHAKQQLALRALLDEQVEQCAAARSEVLRVSVMAGNERVQLESALASARRRAAAAIAAKDEAAGSTREAAVTAEAEARRLLHAEQRKREEQAADSARALALVTQQGEEKCEQLRRELALLGRALETSQTAARRADERAARARAECVKLTEVLRARDASEERLRARLARRQPSNRDDSTVVAMVGTARDTAWSRAYSHPHAWR